jgi:hypothetical protein
MLPHPWRYAAEENYMTFCILETRAYDRLEFFRRLIDQMSLVEPYSECVHNLAQGNVIAEPAAMWHKFDRLYSRLKVKERTDAEAAARV